MQTTEFQNNQDTYSIDDLRERFDELEAMHDAIIEEHGLDPADDKGAVVTALADWDAEYGEEFTTLQTIIDEADRYNVETLISEDHFEDYCQDIIEDCYDLRGIPEFVKNCIDWEGVAAAMAQDYSTIDVDGVTYYYQ
jgi:hypothetical protein